MISNARTPPKNGDRLVTANHSPQTNTASAVRTRPLSSRRRALVASSTMATGPTARQG
jgi:hypothetical protein